MKIQVSTNHNFYEEAPLIKSELCGEFGVGKGKLKRIIQDLFVSTFEITNKSTFLEQIQIFGFKNSRNRLDDEEQTILKLYSKSGVNTEDQYIIQTGLFAGVLYHNECQFNITTPYGDSFLKRMLNFVNDIYVDNQDTKVSKSNDVNQFQDIIAYLFIQSLEKASVLGLPKTYQEQVQRSHKVRGKINLKEYLKKDIPFQGKLTTSYREQVFIQEIVDVLYLACRKIEKNFGSQLHHKIHGVYQLLKQNYSGIYPQEDCILKAKKHSVLNNPMFASFKNVLTYAEIIIKEQDLTVDSKMNSLSTHGYLFDISQLFEVYLEKLISRNFTEWYVTSQENLSVYESKFYSRSMLPDIVMKHKESDEIIVLDAKFKKMRMGNGKGKYSDLDRSDFYQIHSYIQYYQPNIIAGGLIYPLSKEPNIEHSHSTKLFGNNDISTSFIVDGVYVSESMSMAEIIENEIKFLSRINNLITNHQTNTSN